MLAVFLLLNSSVFFFSYLIKQYFFLRQLFCHYTCMTYIPSTQAFYSYFSTNYRGTQWICSSKYIFFGQIFARAGRLGKNAMSLEGTCCWEMVKFRVSEEIQKGCRYVATPSQSYCRKNCSNAPSPEQVFELKPLTKRMDFTSNPRLLPALPQGFIKVHNHTAVYS